MNVLIVDDLGENVSLLVEWCGQLDDVSATGFENPLRALDWCAVHQPDLVIVDYRMPELDGISFIRRLQRMPNRGNVPVLMITADSERTVRHEALSAGASDFLNKPIDRKEFLSRARNMLTLRAGQKALEDRAEWLAREVNKAAATIVERERETIFRLSRAAEYRDPETGAHLMRMANYSKLIAAQLGEPSSLQELILHAAPMHDIGKVGTPDHILLKPGRLTPEELIVMRHHASIGFEILSDSTSPVLQLAATVALTHHEKFDGNGYPSGLTGDAIPLVGRIVAVADVFDALTSERPYKPAWAVDEALDYLQAQSGQHFDPACVQAFMNRLPEVLDIRARYRDSGETARPQLSRAPMA
ncbi:response regulator [Pelomonas sp. P7]|uniref:Response regulator n=1 Tax=Pelomonas caseinilytica TaxID=2906763 RepID=A0ABS8XAC9_9BURK|nr:HD domain-containing phosphohydrolase [Pelomonas sp. P7]MCE4536140.1 response regulator [Pelomonas sp. P7]